MSNKDLKFTDWLKDFDSLGKTEWVTVFYLSASRCNDQITYFSALIANNKVAEVLENYQWDLGLDGGRPGFVTHYVKEDPVTEYYRFSDKGIEPLVYWRTFSGKKDSYYEISEEFRLYFNLFEKHIDSVKKVFIYTNNDGDEDEVVQIDKNQILIKLKYLKEFLAAKQAHLAIYFEGMRFLDKTLAELDQPEVDNIKKGDNYTYSLYIRNLDRGDTKTQGWLLGKKLIAGTKDFKTTIWETKEDDKFEEFIIGVDEDGKETFCSCNVDYQASPGFLTPIFFKREVLKKYYDSPDKYSVEDGRVKCDSFWGLRVLNNHSDHIIVWLEDLKSLPYKEQHHWGAFNLTPSARKISHADFARNINGEFTDPEHPELYFKYKFESFQKTWLKKYGWYLFKPLSKEDTHHMKSLHIPTTCEQKEFDDQVSSITKIIVDSLNEKKLMDKLTINKKDPKGIDKFEVFLDSQNTRFLGMIEFLRNLQTLRSTSVAHRKSDRNKKYKKVKDYFDFTNKDFIQIFEDILIKVVWMLNSLEKHFLDKSTQRRNNG